MNGRIFNCILLAAALLMWHGSKASALGPHEILLLTNASEPDSVRVAVAYAKLRKIPVQNIIKLRLPKPDPKHPDAITPQNFTKYIWSPAVKAARDRGIDDHIQAWVYSTHFPVRTLSRPIISVTGLTFVRNHMPAPGEIGKASYVSPLFTGPDSPSGDIYAPKSFDSAREFLRDEMPLPSMMLGYVGERGNSKAEVVECLKRGRRSDGTKPRGTIYFVVSDDVRSRCRQWQYEPAVMGLLQQGVNAVITNKFPAGRKDVLGLMVGSANPQPQTVGAFVPGAMAEHLTSFGAAFDIPLQTKISRWIAAGATLTSGTVSEPMSIWAKFPNAFFYNHYVYGCTAIESFYQSVRSPLQILPMGDPLASPWGPGSDIKMELVGFDKYQEITAPREVTLRIETDIGTHFSRFTYLVDGIIKGHGKHFVLDPAGLKPGRHKLRAVAYSSGFVRKQIFDVKIFYTK